jgi:hypothetical protein
MSVNEYTLFNLAIENSKQVLEYGSGGSTICLLAKKKLVYSVDSNDQFYNFMHSIKLVRKYLGKNLTYLLIDIGSTDMWGHPVTRDKYFNWANYYESIWQSIEKDGSVIDTIFIDGRFRVACALYSIEKVLSHGWNPVFLIHDFNRDEYKPVLRFLDVIIYSETLYVFRMKENIDREELQKDFEKFKDIFK